MTMKEKTNDTKNKFCAEYFPKTLHGQKQPPEAFCKKIGALKNFAKCTGKHLCQSLFFNKVTVLHLFYRTPPKDCFCMETCITYFHILSNQYS